MSYRVVTADGRRRLALCRLTPTMQIVPGSVVPFSDSIQAGGDWHADARFCTFGARLFLHYNTGSRPQPNQIYLVEIDPDTLLARGPARALVLEGTRRAVEKNWMLFEHEGELWAIYAITPHIVLRVAWAEYGPLLCRPVYRHDWPVDAYQRSFGELRGGTPPVRVGEHYVSFFHSCFPVRRLRSLILRSCGRHPNQNLRYVGGVYGFAAAPPFAPCWLHPVPLIQPPSFPRRQQPPLDQRVERSAYPCGALLQGQQWLVAFGAQEEYCCLVSIGMDAIQQVPVHTTQR